MDKDLKKLNSIYAFVTISLTMVMLFGGAYIL